MAQVRTSDHWRLTWCRLSTGKGIITTMTCPTLKSCQKKATTKTHKKEATFDGAIGDLPVPCSYSHIYPLSARPHRLHRLSWLPSGWCKSEHCTAGTQSWDWAPERKASFFSKRRCGPSSPTFNPTLLLLLLLLSRPGKQPNFSSRRARLS